MLPRIAALIAGLTLLAACGGPGAGQPNTTATKAVAATAQVAAPTVAAVATQVVSTVAPAATAAAPAVGTAAAMSPVQIVDAKLGQPDTTLTVRNSGLTAIDMSGWGLRAGQATATLPPNLRVAPGETITLHTTDGASTGKDVYLGAAVMAALMTDLRPGSKVALIDGQGRVMTEFTLAA